MMTALRVDDLPIESGMLTSSLDEAQKKVENYFFDIRRNLFEYDQVSRDFVGYSMTLWGIVSVYLVLLYFDRQNNVPFLFIFCSESFFPARS